MITLEQKKKLQFDARTPDLPTDLTYECRIAITGEGKRGFEWQDKPHRLVYDLCRQVEADADRIEQLAATCEELVKERDEQKTYTDAAYLERNKLVALFASIYPSGIKRTAIEGWSEDWHGCVYIDFPWGQGSWHYHDSQGYLFSHLPAYSGEWDGHSTEDKYAAIVEASRKDNNATAKLAKAVEALRGWDTAYKTGRNEPLQIAAETTRTVLAELEGK